jgi:MFS family permease
MPFVSVLYLMAFLDRVNIANARAFGLEKDLGLTGVEYNTALTIFFIPYIVFEVPSNIFLKRFSPRVWLSLCCIGFGAVSVFQGLVQNYGGLLATRFFLGVFECGMFPGCFYLLSTWYRRHEAQKRFSLFFSSTSLAGAFGGLLASAIGKMDYIRGYRGWRWIFILEGCLTVVLGVIFLFTFPSFPEQAVCTLPLYALVVLMGTDCSRPGSATTSASSSRPACAPLRVPAPPSARSPSGTS